MERQDVEYEVVNEGETDAGGGKPPASETPRRKRGRRPNAEILAQKSQEELREGEAEIARDRRLSLVDEKFGDGQPYDRIRLEVEVRTHMQNSAASYLQAGYRLIQLKEHEPHGSFLDSLKHIGLGEDVAQKMMVTARKLQGTKIANADTDRYLLPTKLYEIALLDEDQIDDLDSGGTVGPVTLDDISRMTAREVRQTLREERQNRKEEIEVRERVIREKNDKIDELDRELRGLPPKSAREISEAKLKALAVEFIAECSKLQTAMRDMRGLVDQACRLPGLEGGRLKAFSDELIDYGTEAVIVEWEALTDEVAFAIPKEALPDVPALG